MPQPCSIVIFGATGDLTHRKLVPALYNLAADGELPPGIVIVGFARRDKSDDDFRREIEESTRKFSRQPVRDEIWNAFAQSIFYHRSEFGDEAGYEQLAKRLDELDKSHGTRGNRLFYLAAGPDQFESILKNLKAAGLNQTCKGSWARIIIEKPFGSDLASARELNRVVRNSFTRRSDLPHRPFPRKGNRAEHPRPPICQRDFLTAVEHALHRSCADHSSGNTRCRDSGRLLRRRRRFARHGAKSPDSASMSRGDGTAY